ncbi:hypothetical protein AB0M28_10905 [Streptomyces sp. NPDC051940]|uniref:hypothetical protein n=1 Tax=Streptomyces sp. NPDC051940 TaxID=3155675 RepID=UPI00342AF39F
MNDYDFPEDLLQAKREWFAVERQLDELPLRPWTDAAGVTYRDGRGWTPELARREAVLRKRFRELSIQISIHPYWETLTEGVVAARMALRAAGRAREEDGPGGEGDLPAQEPVPEPPAGREAGEGRDRGVTELPAGVMT